MKFENTGPWPYDLAPLKRDPPGPDAAEGGSDREAEPDPERRPFDVSAAIEWSTTCAIC